MAMTAKAWMELYGTAQAPGPDATGWKGFSHPTRKQWAGLRAAYNAWAAKAEEDRFSQSRGRSHSYSGF